MRERYFWLALVLIAISWIANSVYAYSKQLKEPIFLDHYIETTMGEDSYVTFYYLTNKHDQSHINYVRMGEVTGSLSNPYVNYMEQVDTYTHHVLRKMTIRLNIVDLDKDLIINELEVVYSDGAESTFPIGELIIHPAGYFNEDASVLKGSSGGSDNVGSSWDTFQATEPLAIEKMTFPFNQSLGDRFNFSTAGNQSVQSLDSMELPIHLEKDQYMTFRINLNEKNFTNPFDFTIRISGTTDQGKPFTGYSRYHMFPYLTQEDVNRVIEEKTGRDSDE